MGNPLSILTPLGGSVRGTPFLLISLFYVLIDYLILLSMLLTPRFGSLLNCPGMDLNSPICFLLTILFSLQKLAGAGEGYSCLP